MLRKQKKKKDKIKQKQIKTKTNHSHGHLFEVKGWQGCSRELRRSLVPALDNCRNCCKRLFLILRD